MPRGGAPFWKGPCSADGGLSALRRFDGDTPGRQHLEQRCQGRDSPKTGDLVVRHALLASFRPDLGAEHPALVGIEWFGVLGTQAQEQY